MKVILAEGAQRDLREIGDFIAEDNLRAARRPVVALRSASLDLAQFPTKFPIVGQRDGLSIRRRPYGAYLIFYVVTEKGVEVSRILHSARDHERLLFPED
jgi:toxin ParE1/3/4